MQVKDTVARFLWSRDGSIAPISAISILMLLGTVGASIDGARVYEAQQKLQAVADSAVLAAARRAVTDGNSDQIGETFDRFVKVARLSTNMTLQSASPDLSTPRRISASLSADVPTVMLQVLGFKSLQVQAFAAAEFGFTKLEVALALDNTASMSGTKLEALKTSARGLVDTLLDKAPQDGDIRVAVVPFAQYVNVGLDNRTSSWMEVPNNFTQSVESCRDVQQLLGSTNCRTVTYTYTNDGIPMTGSYQQCDNTYGPPSYQCSTYQVSHTWNGCVGSRSYPLNLQDGNYSTRIPGIMNVSCPSEVAPLTSSRSDLMAAIDGMVATGETYMPSGLMWGWRALSPAEPLGESGGDRRDADGNKISKVLILMTDGENTKSPVYPDHTGTDAQLANTLTSESCAAIKGAGIQLFTIAFEITSTQIKDLMRACATKTGHFYDAADAGQLDAALQEIGGQLGGLRLTN